MKIKIHDFTWEDQDWIGLMIFKNFADQDWIGFSFIASGWTRTEKFHSPLISARGEHGQDQDWIFCRILAIFSDRDLYLDIHF